jgi:hypothetical protein
LVDLPIDLNNAYITGLDNNEDKLVKATGNLFEGSMVGVLEVFFASNIGNVFNLLPQQLESLF